MPKAIPPECSGKSEKHRSAQCDEPTHRDVWQNPPNKYQTEDRPEHRAKSEANPKLESVSWSYYEAYLEQVDAPGREKVFEEWRW